MVRSQLALLCVSLMLWLSLAYASGPPQASDTRKQSLKERFTQIPSGSVVEIKLANRQKLRGRLGSIADSGFDLQYARKGRIVTETFAFDSVRSVRLAGHGWSTGKKILVGALSGAGIFFIIGLVACLAGGCRA